MHTSLSSNSLTFSDGSSPELIAAVYPSSPESGAAAIGTYGNLATLLDLDDVAALRDLLTTCLVQAGRENEWTVDDVETATDAAVRAELLRRVRKA